MGTGAITEQIDVALLAFNLFFLFFIGLVAYLHREGKREGYPLLSDLDGKTAAAYDSLSASARVLGRAAGTCYHLAASVFDTGGYREHSAARRATDTGTQALPRPVYRKKRCGGWIPPQRVPS